MSIDRIVSPECPEPAPGLWSNCLKVRDTVYVSGLTARDAAGEASGGTEYQQARAIFARIKSLVEAAGGTMADVVKLNIYVTDIGRREDVWRARREFFSGAFPVSTLVQVAALAPGIAVEIEAVAILGQGGRPAEAA